jgi:type II secretory ATPase GspE/PulE/Tfp pilus assembly ATPase PilB-like protein
MSHVASQARAELQQQLDSLQVAVPDRTSRLVDLILSDAVRRAASDVHIEPNHRAVEVRYRLDGVLHSVVALKRELALNLVARLKVLAELLTYRIDVPQEGRISDAFGRYGVDMRVSTFPVIHGEKAVVRIFDGSGQTRELEHLGLDEELWESLHGLLRERAGAVLLTGPSGSGKTTTIYACLRHILRVSAGGRHIVTIEDPVEQVIEGISQSQARPGTEFDFARGLRSLLRQDPEVIMVGEIRDAETAAIAIEASLTGHLVITTLHAGSACGVISRLLDMGVEPYLLTSAVRGILSQRLVRRTCAECGGCASDCKQCAGTGYRGRLLLAELLLPDAALRRAVLAKSDTTALEATVHGRGQRSLREVADKAVKAGLTSSAEVERVLGPGA